MMAATTKIRSGFLIEANTQDPQWLPQGQHQERQVVTVIMTTATQATMFEYLGIAIT
jgi:hypothetical protein